jgi:hypothetical protein
MLNLSDKELDRLSKEAAQEYEPGEILGPNSWEKLAIRLDSDLGRVNPNPLRHIRRFPFYYAPALLVLLGISYYYLTKHPPSTQNVAQKTITHQNPTNTTNSTPANPATPATPSSVNPSGPATTGDAKPAAADRMSTSGRHSSANNGSGDGRASSANDGSAASRASSEKALTPRGSGNAPIPVDRNAFNSRSSRNQTVSADRGASDNRPASGQHRSSNTRPANGRPLPIDNSSNPNGLLAQAALSTLFTQNMPSAIQPHELTRATIGGLSDTKTPPDISDSALRAFNEKSMPPPPVNRALHISRNWQFGLLAAPDFASVNSLAGDKPGSTLGLTVDYQFAPRWYIGSGLLLDRRNYAARPQDFHAPLSYYSSNGIDPRHVEFVKGSFQMLEIPLNLRYDFSVTGSTLFFATAGLSSYLFAADYGNCYVRTLSGHEMPWGFKQPGTGNYLFSSMSLSLGVETGLSNSMSLLIAPYVKMPLRSIGFGQVQMNSVGISFSLKWAPVTSMRRR